MTREDIEKEMKEKGLSALHVTPELIESLITGEDYYVFPGTTVTVCLLKLKNGFSTIGESACISPENYDPVLGRNIARSKARDKIFQLEAYALCWDVYQSENMPYTP